MKVLRTEKASSVAGDGRQRYPDPFALLEPTAVFHPCVSRGDHVPLVLNRTDPELTVDGFVPSGHPWQMPPSTG